METKNNSASNNTLKYSIPVLEKLDWIKAFYFFIHIGFALMMIYLPNYMGARGFSGKQIAGLTSIGFFLAFFVPVIAGFIADKTGRPSLLVKICTFFVFISLIPFLIPETNYTTLMVMYFFYSLFLQPIMGNMDSIATAKVKETNSDYGKIRLWATIGWFIAATGFGIVLDVLDLNSDSPSLFIAAIVAFGLVFLVSLTVKERIPKTQDKLLLKDLKLVVKDKAYVIFLIASFFHYMAMQPFAVFQGPFTQELGFSDSILGLSSGMAVGAEVIVMLVFGWCTRKFKLESILLFAVIVTAVRWYLISTFSTSVPFVLVQVLHGATGGFYIAGAVSFAAKMAPDKLKVSYQMFYNLVGAGLGNLVGVNITGFLGDYFASYQKTFLIAGFIEIIPIMLFILLVIKYSKRNTIITA